MVSVTTARGRAALALGVALLAAGAVIFTLDQARAEREHDASTIVRRARAAGVAAHVLIWSGDAATCVIDAAQAEGAERIVVGSHGRGRLARAIAGSVSASVNERAEIRVEVVRADSD